MNYKWARDFTLELINQYSIAGAVVPGSYNNQADYLLRIPKLLNDAQMYVATNQGRIRTSVPMSTMEHEQKGSWVSYKLPADCWQVCSSGIVILGDEGVQRFHRYHQIGGDTLLVPSELDGELLLEYFRYPKLLEQNPLETDELDNTPVAQMVLPYYVAAHLVMHDNDFAYQSLYNEFEAKMARLAEVPKTEVTAAEDSYGGAGWSFSDM